MTAAGFRLGVDFGTSNTVAALVGPDGRVQPLLFDGSPLLPSAVFADIGTGLLCGRDAVRAAFNVDPSGLELHPKRRIDEGAVWLGEYEYPVTELIAAVLSRVATEAARVALSIAILVFTAASRSSSTSIAFRFVPSLSGNAPPTFSL